GGLDGPVGVLECDVHVHLPFPGLAACFTMTIPMIVPPSSYTVAVCLPRGSVMIRTRCRSRRRAARLRASRVPFAVSGRFVGLRSVLALGMNVAVKFCIVCSC